ncbi:MAG TPA: epoxyqueuosine reductase QueH [Treponemataceae bacterium]|nr:epoxyqueuosine reductase QueH [Treponemataceae bacterium]
MNYQREMEKTLEGLEGTPSLMLHSCCGPCSTAVIAVLSSFFKITVLYYNPNIDDRAEYEKRAREQERLIAMMPTPNPVAFLEGEYDPEEFLSFARDRADDPEGGDRCTLCYGLRIERTALEAKKAGCDYFTTTLSLSPMKDAKRINALGDALGKKHGVAWLWSDFKKKNGFLKSIELSREYGLYRQDFCGCSFSRRKADRILP